MARKAVIRSKRRLRLGPRTALVLALLLILIWLLATILGHRQGGNETDRPGERGPGIRNPEQGLGGSGGPGEADPDAPPFRLTRWQPARHQAADAEVETRTEVDGAFITGSSYLRFRVPERFSLRDLRIEVEAVQSSLPGLRAEKLLRSLRRIEPDLVILELESVPGGIWLELATLERAELHGPFETNPLELIDLPPLEVPEGSLDLDDFEPGPSLLAPELRTLAGEGRPIVHGAATGGAPGPITRGPEERGAGPRRFFGPYTFRSRLAKPGLSSSDRRALESLALGAPGALLATEIEGHEDISVLGADALASVVPGQRRRLLLPGGGVLPFDDGGGLASPELARLRLPRGSFDRLRFLLVETGDAGRSRRRALERDLLLFAEENFELDPDDPDFRVLPFLPGTYEIVDLAEADPLAGPLLGTLVLAASETTSFEMPALRDEGSLLLEIRDAESGAVIPGALVSLSREAAREDWLPSRQLSDQEGRFRATGLPRQPLQVGAWAEGYLPAWREVDLGDAADLELVLELRPGPSLQVVARDPAGGTVEVDGFLALGRGGAAFEVPLGKDGLARFPRLSPDRYVVLPILGEAMMQMDDWRWLEQDSGGLIVDHEGSGGKLLEFRMPALEAVEISISVEGLAGPFDLHLVPAEKLPAPGLWPRIFRTAVVPGVLKIDGLPPGRYRAVASRDLANAVADFEVRDEAENQVALHLDFN